MKKLLITASIIISNSEGKILTVREADPRVYGKVNFPGGHIEDGESVIECAIREAREETGLSVSISGVLGIYIQDDMNSYIFLGESDNYTLRPGKDIVSCQWLDLEEARKIPEPDIIRPKKFMTIIQDLMNGRHYPKELIRTI